MSPSPRERRRVRVATSRRSPPTRGITRSCRPICRRWHQAGRSIESRAFAWGDYLTALTKGNTLTDAERDGDGAEARAASPACRRTSSSNAQPAHQPGPLPQGAAARQAPGRRPARRPLHRRPTLDAAGEQRRVRPLEQALQGPYTAMFQDYVKNELKWESDLHYPTSGNVRPWTYDAEQLHGHDRAAARRR